MPVKEVSMHKIREIFRLHFEAGLSQRQIAASVRLSPGVINKYLKSIKETGISWPLPGDLDEQKLRRLLLKQPNKTSISHYAEPNYVVIHQELKKKGVTLQLLWEEHRLIHAESYGYAQYCRHYASWRGTIKPSMRQVHKAGDKLFIDYAGPTVEIIDAATGEIKNAQIFVATLGASNYTYAEATWDQTLPNWIASHVRAFAFFGGVPALLVPDNLKSAINKACRFEPDVNTAYGDLACHYGTAILPARPYKPKDKAKVECAVLVVERWILARLRHHTFFSLRELNVEIQKLLVDLNERPFKRMPGCRKSVFESVDKPALRPLPEHPYEYAEFKKARVHIDYHVEVDGHFYSVPFSLVKKEIDVRLTASTIECFDKGKRVASHARSSRGGFTTCVEHMPKAHQKHLEWSPGRFLNWGIDIGPSTRDLVQHLLEKKPHPEQGYRACLGLLSLAKQYNKERLEAACKRSLAIGAPTGRSVKSILVSGLDKAELNPVVETTQAALPLIHENIRGAAYYDSVQSQQQERKQENAQ
jgi:transposase